MDSIAKNLQKFLCWLRKCWLITEPEVVSVGISISGYKYTVAVLDSDLNNGLKKVFSIEDSLVDNVVSKLRHEVERLGLKGKRCNLVLPEDAYQLFLVERPDVDDVELKSALRWRIAEHVTGSVNELSIDYIELPSKNRNQQKKLVYVVVANTQKVQEYKLLLQKAGLIPGRVEIPELAIRNIAIKLKDASKGQVILKFNGDDCQVILIRGNYLLLMRKITIQSSTEVDLQEKIQQVALEIQRTIDYCSSHIMDASHLNIVYLDQDGSHQLLIDGLEKALGLDVEAMNMAEIIDNKAISKHDLDHGFIAIGSVLEG